MVARMAGFFSAATLEQIRAASDIVDVIGSYLPLKRAGANFVALLIINVVRPADTAITLSLLQRASKFRK